MTRAKGRQSLKTESAMMPERPTWLYQAPTEAVKLVARGKRLVRAVRVDPKRPKRKRRRDKGKFITKSM